MFTRVVLVVQALAVLAALTFVVLLFANEPDGEPANASPGAAVFSASCAACHGADGGGGTAPNLQKIATVYPDAADEIAVVTNGRSGMPAWGGRLTDAEIVAVVDYTRTGL